MQLGNDTLESVENLGGEYHRDTHTKNTQELYGT